MSIANVIINCTVPRIKAQLLLFPDSTERGAALTALETLADAFRASETLTTALVVELAKYKDSTS